MDRLNIWGCIRILLLYYLLREERITRRIGLPKQPKRKFDIVANKSEPSFLTPMQPIFSLLHQLIYIFISIYFFTRGFFFSLHFRTDFIREKKPRGESKIHTQAIGKGKSLIFKDIARKNLIYIYIYTNKGGVHIHTEQLIRTFSVFFFFMGCVLVKFYFFFFFPEG